MNSVSVVVDQRKIDKKHHHLSYVDDYGMKQSLGKYGNKQEAEGVGRQFTSLIVDRKSHEYECYDAQQRLIQQGLPLEKIPTVPYFNLPTMTGNDFLANMSTIAKATKEHKQVKDQYIAQAKTLATIEPRGFTASERDQIKQEIAPHIKNDPKEHGKAYKAYRAIGKGVDKFEKVLSKAGVSGEFNAVTISGSHTNTSPSLIHVRTQAPKKRPTYGEMQHQINLERGAMQTIETSRFQQRGSWNDVQSFQQQRMFQENMAFRSPELDQHTTQTEISQQSVNVGDLWGNGVARNVQRLPNSVNALVQSGIAQPIESSTRNISLEISGAIPFAISKVIPKKALENVNAWVNDYIQEWKDDPMQARKNLDVAVILGVKKAVVVAIQAFEQPTLKERPNTYGLEELSSRCDHWVADKFDVNLESKNAQMGMFIGEFFAPMGMVKKSRPMMKVGQEAVHFLRTMEKGKPLLDRVVMKPVFEGQQLAIERAFSKNVRAIESFQQPAYRSGFVAENAVQQARKAVNLPSWKKVDIWMDHILSGHTDSGWRTGCKGHNKTLFPEGFSEKQLEKVIRQAYRNGKKIKTQEEVVVIIGEYQGIQIKMYVNTSEKIIKTAYPIK